MTATTHTQPRLALRPYQEDALRAVLDGIRRGIHRQLIVMAVGAGKTLLASRLPERLGDPRLLYVCHREDLLEQTLRVFRADRPDRPAGVEQAERRPGPHDVTVVSTIQSLHQPARLATYRAADWDLLVIDEAHRSPTPSYIDVVRHFQFLPRDGGPPRARGLLLGLTGTSRRTDNVGLGNVFEEVVSTTSLRELVDHGYLVALRGALYTSGTSLESVRVHTTEEGDRDYDIDALARAVNTPARNQLVVDATRELVLKDTRPTLVFAADIAHTEALAHCFERAGARAAAIHSRMSSSHRRALLERFRTGELELLVNCELLIEGIDLPFVSGIVMARPTQSSILYTQALGRGLRLHPGKTDCYVLDVVDNSPKHAASLITLPTLFGLPVQFNLHGARADETARHFDTAARALPSGIDERTVDQIRSPEDIPRLFREFDFWTIIGLPATLAQATQFAWQRLPRGAYVLHIPRARTAVQGGAIVLSAQTPGHDLGGHLVVEDNALGHAEVRFRPLTGRPVKLAEMPDPESALRSAEAYASEQYADRLPLMLKHVSWRDRPASPRQIEQLRRLHIRAPGTLTSGQASAIISLAQAMRIDDHGTAPRRSDELASINQLRYLRHLHRRGALTLDHSTYLRLMAQLGHTTGGPQPPAPITTREAGRLIASATRGHPAPRT